MAKVVIYTTAACPFCIAAKRLLEQQQVAFEEIRVDVDPGRRQEMMQRSRRRTVPQIFIGSVHVGGYDDLAALSRHGELTSLLSQP